MDLLSGFQVVWETPVAWGEMDALGHVNNIYYFRYFESARALYFQKVGIWEYGDRHGIGVILHSTNCRFRRPLTYPDTVFVGTRSADIGADRFKMEYKIVSREQEAVIAEGEGLIVSYDYRKKTKCALPEEIRRAMEALEKSQVF